MPFLGIDFYFRLLSPRLPDGGNHPLGAFSRDNPVLGSRKSIDGDLGKVSRPLCKIIRNSLGSSPANSSYHWNNGREMIRAIPSPDPAPITTHAVTGQVDPLLINRECSHQVLKEDIEIFRHPGSPARGSIPETLWSDYQTRSLTELPDPAYHPPGLPLYLSQVITHSPRTMEIYQQWNFAPLSSLYREHEKFRIKKGDAGLKFLTQDFYNRQIPLCNYRGKSAEKKKNHRQNHGLQERRRTIHDCAKNRADAFFAHLHSLCRVARAKSLHTATLTTKPETTTIRRKATKHPVELAVTTFASSSRSGPQTDLLNGRYPRFLNRGTQLGLRHPVAVAHELTSLTLGKPARILHLHA